MLNQSHLFSILSVISLLLPSTGHSMIPENDAKPVKREMRQGGWKKVPQNDKPFLIPTATDNVAVVQYTLHGFQFKHLGEVERRFASACEKLPAGDVVIWGDGYGRVSVDAFRRNAKLRIFYNDIDQRNSQPLQHFKDYCVKDEDKDKLIMICGSCLDIPHSPTFCDFFPDHKPFGKLPVTFGANFLHFMTPINVVNYLGLQYDLLIPGGQTFTVAYTCHVPDEYFQYTKGLSQSGLQEIISKNKYVETNAVRGVMAHQLRQYFKDQGLFFYGYFNGEFFRNAASLLPGHRVLLADILFAGREAHFFPDELLISIAQTIGFEVEFKDFFGIYKDGSIKENAHEYGGYIFRKPLNAPQPTDESYFRKTAGFQDLEKKALQEPEIIREVCEKRVSFKPMYPFFTIMDK